MRLILIDGIPSWQDGDLTLPVVAGGQEDPWAALFGAAEEEEEADLQLLDELLGQVLVDTGSRTQGILKTRIDRRTGQRVYWLSEDGRAFDLGASPTLMNPSTFQLYTLTPTGTVMSGGKASEFQLQQFGFVETSAPTGRAPPAFSGTSAGLQFQNDLAVAEAKRQEAVAAGNLLEARQWEEKIAEIQNRFTTAEREAGQEFTAEENRLAEEAALKRQRLATLTDLIQSFLQQQSQARDTLANLQPDPFRFAAVAGGIAPFGTTPQQGFQTQLQQFAGAAVPSFDASGSAASLEPVIAQLTGAQAPQQPQIFGAAEGVVIEMSKGSDGSYSAVPLPFDVQARLVGENPDGTVNKTTEVMITSSQGVTIIPLGKGFQEGGAIGFPFQPIQFNRESLLPALTTSGIFQTGQNIPRARLMPDQSVGGGIGFTRSMLEQAGTRPSFFSPFGRDEIFFRDPNNPGQFRLVTDRPELGGSATSRIQPGSVTQVTQADFDAGLFGTLRNERFGIGANELFESLAMVRDTSPFTRFSAPIIEPTTGTVLPAPFEVAEQLNQLRVTNPGAFNLLLNAYKNSTAQIPPAAVLSTIQSSLAFGSARGNIGLR